jgi:hypothetical protein
LTVKEQLSQIFDPLDPNELVSRGHPICFVPASQACSMHQDQHFHVILKHFPLDDAAEHFGEYAARPSRCQQLI